MQQLLQLAMAFVGRRKNVLNRDAFQSRTASDVEKATAILEASFPVAFGNVERNRLGSAKPLVASMTMATDKILCDCE